MTLPVLRLVIYLLFSTARLYAEHADYLHRPIQHSEHIDLVLNEQALVLHIPKGISAFGASRMFCETMMTGGDGEVEKKMCIEKILEFAIPSLRRSIVGDIVLRNAFGDIVSEYHNIRGELPNIDELVLYEKEKYENNIAEHENQMFHNNLIHIVTMLDPEAKYHNPYDNDIYSKGYCYPMLTCPLSAPIAYLESPRCASTSIKKWISDREYKHGFAPTEFMGHYPRTTLTCCAHGKGRTPFFVSRNPYARLVSFFRHFALGKQAGQVLLVDPRGSKKEYVLNIHGGGVVKSHHFRDFIASYVLQHIDVSMDLHVRTQLGVMLYSFTNTEDGTGHMKTSILAAWLKKFAVLRVESLEEDWTALQQLICIQNHHVENDIFCNESDWVTEGLRQRAPASYHDSADPVTVSQFLGKEKDLFAKYQCDFLAFGYNPDLETVESIEKNSSISNRMRTLNAEEIIDCLHRTGILQEYGIVVDDFTELASIETDSLVI